MSVKDDLIKIVEDAKSDNLERANACFGGLSESEMDREYGQSGRTYREIIDGYKRDREKWKVALELAKGIKG